MYERLLGPVVAKNRMHTLLLGPRQVGKSTLIKGVRPDVTVNLASPATYRTYVARPERLQEELALASPSIHTVFIDEIQRVPDLLNALQVLIDEDPKRFRFVLTGSSARKLRGGRANLLPGRLHAYSLHPLVIRELGDEFDLERCLAHGTLPGVYNDGDRVSRERTLKSYADVYIREEVQAEALVRDIGGYSRLLELVAAMSGRILNLNALSQEAGIAYETTRRYIQVLEDTLVTFTVPAWSGSDKGSLVAHPRVYMFDLGVRNALLRRPLDRTLPDERGFLLEHLVAYEIYRRLDDLMPNARLFHFRTRHGAEVDFILDTGDERWAIEVKSSWTVGPGDLSGLDAFANRSNRPVRKIVVFLGQRRQKLDDAEAIPLLEFCDELPT